eukprot:9672106-Heterocapsa_arctica.AAC.1
MRHRPEELGLREEGEEDDERQKDRLAHARDDLRPDPAPSLEGLRPRGGVIRGGHPGEGKLGQERDQA